MKRRDFLATGLALLAPRPSRAASARIDILPDEPVGVIAPEIYSHFTEHLGGCIYDGIWVGENSKIPNIGGIRRELVEHLKLMKASVIRWPGGCFADSYNWRDGIGPRDRRPKRTNFWADTPYLKKAPNGPQKYEPNQFGTNEFLRFCQLSGAQPYLAANLRSLNAFDFYEWVEYCNSPAGTTTLAQIREQGGLRDPIPVRFWGVGNESWGCGGNFTGSEYAVEFRRFAEWIPRFGVDLSLIASGPNGDDYAWTRSFFQGITEKNKGALRNIFGIALHYYCGSTGNRQSTDFNEDGWYLLLSHANRMEELISNHWAIMGEVDQARRIKLVVDEWGAWHETDPQIDPSYLWAYFPTLRDALVSGITLDIFNRHADKVAMANAAQLINDIHSSFLAVGDRFTVTPNYHVFRMYSAHQGNKSVRTLFSSALIEPSANVRVPAFSGSCSVRERGGVLTVVNADLHNPQDAEIVVRGRQIRAAKATVLTAPDMHAHNTFEQPNALQPTTKDVAGAAPFVYQFAPASVTALEFEFS